MTGLRLRVRRPLARASSPGAAAGVALLALTAVAPGPVLADNGTSLIDMWPTINMMIFGGMTTPFIFWMAKRFPPPPPPDPPYLPPPPPPSDRVEIDPLILPRQPPPDSDDWMDDLSVQR